MITPTPPRCAALAASLLIIGSCLAKPGDKVSAGSRLLRVHLPTATLATPTLARLEKAFEISAKPPTSAPLIVEVV